MMQNLGNSHQSNAFSVAIDRMPRPVFAVLDGAKFDDIEDEMSEVGIRLQSLFRDGGSTAMRRDGPWLVDLTDKHVRCQILEKSAYLLCAVFWSCSTGEDALRRHLRSINEVDFAIIGSTTQDGEPRYERLLFRHWDPNVLAQVLPALGAVQFSHVLGPAEEIYFLLSPEWGVIKRAKRPEDGPKIRGRLRIDLETIKAIEDARLGGSRRKIAAYLAEVHPETGEISSAEQQARIEKSEETGNALGLKSERAHMKWAYLMSATDGEVLQRPETRAVLIGGDKLPDDRIDDLLDLAEENLRRTGRFF